MPEIPIVMPQLGESIAEATIVRFNVAVGDTVEADQEIIEVETNKATMGVTTLCGGVVKEILAEEGVSYAVGSVLGTVEATEEELERTGVTTVEAHQEEHDQAQAAEEEANVHFKTEGAGYFEPKAVEPNVKGLPVPMGKKGAHYISPRMRARMNELGLQAADISAVTGSGAGGRVTVEDLEQFLEYISTWPASSASPMRLAVADAMRRSWTRPLATVGMPLVMDRLLEYRSQQNPKPGLTLYVLRAFALALSEIPSAAGYLIGGKIVEPRAFDIGLAVQVEDGVMVPVLRSVDTKSVQELSQEYSDLVDKARARRLTEEHTKGGVATVTNFGTFGLTWATPIPLPNETLILGISAGVKKPVWSDQVETFIPVTEAELNLTFDHRVIDGGDAGRLLKRVVELLSKPETL
ncbi:pyruvate dehydrogenase E2 component (dihydrolipoamide acetyltransferase) [Rubritalea squalenifaciens DSM 18772]|uniref:Dihydrolipoamide acetyltransferase component of pyruvate dehydrogenase complex n=1 Tax=Rubritalea squalenifaciens DSM 18772 TaxID=1123071 RepID=A0A1M6EVY3_9BACT|nr:dihydrolipoamide acetyltransferase family protein [Rubritalea squalenifaciens]SHI89615.1 pyruvate dehydrogenase E2 component (dihydrolipoamide acetyltransferase) [Rubritalea squalenifaciens DSM 18772]